MAWQQLTVQSVGFFLLLSFLNVCFAFLPQSPGQFYLSCLCYQTQFSAHYLLVHYLENYFTTCALERSKNIVENRKIRLWMFRMYIFYKKCAYLFVPPLIFRASKSSAEKLQSEPVSLICLWSSRVFIMLWLPNNLVIGNLQMSREKRNRFLNPRDSRWILKLSSVERG